MIVANAMIVAIVTVVTAATVIVVTAVIVTVVTSLAFAVAAKDAKSVVVQKNVAVTMIAVADAQMELRKTADKKGAHAPFYFDFFVVVNGQK